MEVAPRPAGLEEATGTGLRFQGPSLEALQEGKTSQRNGIWEGPGRGLLHSHEPELGRRRSMAVLSRVLSLTSRGTWGTDLHCASVYSPTAQG